MSTLHRGDRIKARPCIVTITLIRETRALGWCETCQHEHIIDRRIFNDGKGPWVLEEKDG